MLKTMQSGGQLRNSAETDDGNSESSQSESSELTTLLQSLKGSKVSKTQLREKIFEALYDNATEQPEVGKVPIARLPGGLKMDGIAPNIGSNTKDVMLEYGYSLDQVEQLNREKVVFAPELSN